MSNGERNMNLKRAATLLITAAAIVVVGKAILKIDTTVILLLSGVATSVLAFYFGSSYEEIQGQMVEGFKGMAIAIMILVAIGAMVGSWIISGTIPTMMYWGMKSLNATFFLPFTFALCLMMGLATGTSWGTISTVGVALLGISHGLEIPVAYTAGAIVSGAYMGDTISPLSDAPLMAAASCNVPLMEHIRNSLRTALPAGLIALVIFTLMGLRMNGGVVQGEAYSQILEVLPKTFNLNAITILPVLVVLALILMKKPTIPTLTAGAITGLVIAMLVQGTPFLDAVRAFSAGYRGDTGSQLVNGLLNRGGINSMIGTISIVIAATAFGAPLKASGAIRVLLDEIKKVAKTSKQLMFFTALIHPIFFIMCGAYYVSYSVIGSVLSPIYDSYGVDRKNLSAILGLTGITIAALIPWSPAGAFTISQLGMPTGVFFPYSFFNLAAITLCIVFVMGGIGFEAFRKKKPA